MANYSKKKKYHFTYKTTNIINSRYYLGMHSTNRIDDGYLGSGTRLRYEVTKYGRDNFKVEIIKYFNSREDLVQAEMQLITEQDLNSVNCLNLITGGNGFSIETSRCANEIRKQKLQQDVDWREAYILKLKDTKKEWVKNLTQQDKDTISKKIKRGLKKSGHIHNSFLGKKHSKETILKMKKAKIGQGCGNKNSQYGKPRSEETKKKIRESLRKTREMKKNAHMVKR